MITVLTRRLLMRVAVLLAVAALMVAALATGLANSPPARYAFADNGVIHGYGILAENGVINADSDGVIHGYGILAADGVINADGIQGSGSIHPDDDGVIHGF